MRAEQLLLFISQWKVTWVKGFCKPRNCEFHRRKPNWHGSFGSASVTQCALVHSWVYVRQSLAKVIQSLTEESIVCRRQSTQARDAPWPRNPGQTPPEVQNRGITGPTKRTDVIQFFLNKTAFQKDTCRLLENCTCFSFGCYHQMLLWVGRSQMNKLEEVSSDRHQMSLAGVGH